MEEPSTDVRQSAYALLGDCAIMVFPQLEPWLPRVVPFLADQLDLDLITDEDSENGFNVLNNVCWSCGELGAKAGAKVAPWIEAQSSPTRSLPPWPKSPQRKKKRALFLASIV